MKSSWPLIGATALFAVCQAHSQGTLIFDQQTSTIQSPLLSSFAVVQDSSPGFGQGFITTLPGVGFIRLNVGDDTPGNSLGATLYLNLRSGSITGPVISTSLPVPLPDSFSGTATFLFASQVALTPGTQYFFEPVVQSGDRWDVGFLTDTFYQGGTPYYHGNPVPFTALWFREGIVVPEPSPAALLALATTLFLSLRRTKTS